MVKDMAYSNELDKLNIGVITHPFNDLIAETLLSNLLEILEPLSYKISVITGNFSYKPNKKINIIKMSEVKTEWMALWFFKQIVTQLMVSYNFIKISKNVDIIIFFLGARSYLLPILFAKLLGKRTVVIAAGSAFKTSNKLYNKMLFGIGGIIISYIVGVLEKSNYILSDRIVAYSESSVRFLGLNRFKNKISLHGDQFIDMNLFKVKKSLENRRNLVGCIGRLSEEKGVINFVKAIPIILKEHNYLEFFIGGGGPLSDKIKEELEKNKLLDKVTLGGWIFHDEVPDYLNELKLLVVPSYTEAGPYIVLEAMLCGTPVAATSVGFVPDLIKDGKTGFILENNSPECIAACIIKSLKHPKLNEIVKNARKLIENEHAYKAMVKKYKITLYDSIENNIGSE